MGTYDDDTLPLQPPIRLPATPELAAAVRATPLAEALLRSADPAASASGPGLPDTVEVDELGGAEMIEVLRHGDDEEVLRVWEDVRRRVLGEAHLVRVVRLFLGREAASETGSEAAGETPGTSAGGVPGELVSLGLARPAEPPTLTPLGLWAGRQVIAEVTGQEIPVMGSLAAEDAAALLHGLRCYPERERLEELTGWLATRERGKAAEEIGAALVEASPLGRAIGVELLATDLGDEGREVLDRLLGTPRVGAVIGARLGRDDRHPAPDEIAWVLVDMAATLLEFGGESDEVVESVGMGMAPEDQAGTIALLALGDHPWTGQVLRVFIDRHPDAQVSAAARKALRRLHGLAQARG
ncbi:hypothetical protein [Nonomuraea cavernae]|uniref:hypothetical protein n=1 Tax=Nonomuraea cavernae TaxID=2045107 RepID=UPI00166EE008|nr:hypothetical protein [Nonomuraea cavernae]MCA2184427.1 hypothetical protein [Nonomuraea cavernae]